MNTPRPRHHGPKRDPSRELAGELALGAEPASRLLRLALQPAVQPADLLIEFALSQRDSGWIDEAFRRGGIERWSTPAERGEAQLRGWRDDAKRAFESGTDFRVRAGALFVYAWCVAESILRFGTSASSQPRDTIDALLGAAASIAPERMRETFEAALTRETPD